MPMHVFFTCYVDAKSCSHPSFTIRSQNGSERVTAEQNKIRPWLSCETIFAAKREEQLGRQAQAIPVFISCYPHCQSLSFWWKFSNKGAKSYRARLSELCYCSCLPLLPGFVFSIHTTRGPPFSQAPLNYMIFRVYLINIVVMTSTFQIPKWLGHGLVIIVVCNSSACRNG